MKQEKAYYHLPGLFEFYELYREFLPLFRAHREYFYDWCDIGQLDFRADALNLVNRGIRGQRTLLGLAGDRLMHR